MQTNTKLIGTLATLMLATLAIVGLTATGGAAVATENVTIDDPANDTVEVDVDYSSSLTSDINATVELVNDNGTVVDSQMILGSPGTTETFTVSASEAGDYTVDVTSEDETNTTLAATRLVAERAVSVEDVGNETVYVDVGFQGEDNATADITLMDSSGTELYTDTVEYDATTDETTHMVAINESDGLTAGDLMAQVATNPASAYTSAYAGLEEPNTGGLIGGTIAGQDTTIVLVVVLVLGGVGYYAREEGWL